jgi:site-specific recombinase XerD
MSAERFAALVQGFFAARLRQQIQVSPNTISAYRDTFRLLFRYVRDRLGKQPSELTLDDLDVAVVIDFLNHLERERHNTARTRNHRLAAIRSFMRHVVMSEPAYALHCQRILAIPQKRHEKREIEFLRREEIEALIAAPDTSKWRGRRDRAILLVMTQAGLRVSELTSLRAGSVVPGPTAYVKCSGKGRKSRSTPLRQDARDAVSAWLDENGPASTAPLFPSSRGSRLSTDAVEALVFKHTVIAGRRCPSLVEKHVTPHVLRHTAAMALREQGVDLSVIALWLGHESVETTQMYMHADLQLKERALARTAPVDGDVGRYVPDDALMAFLESL